MNILRFIEEFPDEHSCITHFKKSREKEGVICKKCNSKEHYWLKNKNQWECKTCKFRTTLRSGTIMHGSNLKLRIWYLAMAFMSFSKKGISAKKLLTTKMKNILTKEFKKDFKNKEIEEVQAFHNASKEIEEDATALNPIEEEMEKVKKEIEKPVKK